MKIHILGICGTFMGGVAALARELGYEVSGCDQGMYPPMSDTLQQLGVTLHDSYDIQHLQPHPDLVIIGNVLSRGNPCVEYVLNQNIPYTSGAQWLSQNVLQAKHVLAVAGTHGKTTTASLLTWILEHAGLNPGYLIGGVANNFDKTARLGGQYFVIEADEYDTAFFDKAAKFLHYRPHRLILNNVEFDHADIFPDLASIKRQFEILLRTVPSEGTVIVNGEDDNVADILSRGCWSREQLFNHPRGWRAEKVNEDWSAFDVYFANRKRGHVAWSLLGRHNVSNALAAIAAASAIELSIEQACNALSTFQGVRRRLEVRGRINDVTVYDDFAHHPTAIRETVSALRQRVGQQRIIAVLQFGSNTMKLGEHRHAMAPALAGADQIVFLEPDNFSTQEICQAVGDKAVSFPSVDAIVGHLRAVAKPGDHILMMSNKSFFGIHTKLLHSLSSVTGGHF